MNVTGRLLSLGAMAVSGFIAPKIAAAGWKSVTGEEPPSEDSDSRLVQIVAFAAISAVLVTTLQVLTMRGVKKALPSARGEKVLD